MNSRYEPQKFIAEDWKRLKDHIKGFFLSLDRNEKSKLLHDNEFREFLIKNTKPGHDLEYILSYFSREDIDNLFDDAFLSHFKDIKIFRKILEKGLTNSFFFGRILSLNYGNDA